MMARTGFRISKIRVMAASLSSSMVVGAIFLSAMFADAGDRSRAAKVTVIGIDALGKAVGMDLPADRYQQSLAAGLSAVNTSIRPALSEKSAQPERTSPATGPTTGQKSWNLRTIGVGVGLKGEIGLGPLFSVSLSPRLRLIFTNSVEPIYPL